jgi:transposase
MEQYSEAYIGLDVSKLRNAVAVAEGGRNGEIRYLGELDNTPEATRKLVMKLAAKYERLHFCYEAGPTGYGLHRWPTGLGHSCTVVAPSLIPQRADDRVKTNRRDAQGLAKLLRAGELTAVWVPGAAHEAVRDLVRARSAAVRDVRGKRQQVTAFLLRHSRSYPGKTAWGARHHRWLAEQCMEHRAQQVALAEMIGAVRDAEERQKRLELYLCEAVQEWSLGPVVDALQAMRGIRFVAAVTFMAEVGDLSRFVTPRQLMGYLGLVSSERSTGDSVKRGSITKAGNAATRTMLVESSWCYKHAPRIGAQKRYVVDKLPKPVADIAWKAQSRLCRRHRMLTQAGKPSVVVNTAIAREMAAFMWAIAREVQPKTT